MNFRVTFKHMGTSEAVIAYARQRLLQRLRKYVDRGIEMHVTFEVERGRHAAQCQVVGAGLNLAARAEEEGMYAAIDRLADRLEAQLKRHKEKLKGRKHIRLVELPARPVLPALPAREAALEEEGWDADELLRFEKARKRLASLH